MKDFFKGKSLGWYLTIPGIILMVVSFFLYINNGITQFQPELNVKAIVFIWISFALGVAGIITDIKYFRFGAYLTGLYALIMFIYSQVTYIANVLTAIDGTSFSAGFISTLICLLCGTVLLLLSGCLAGKGGK